MFAHTYGKRKRATILPPLPPKQSDQSLKEEEFWTAEEDPLLQCPFDEKQSKSLSFLELKFQFHPKRPNLTSSPFSTKNSKAFPLAFGPKEEARKFTLDPCALQGTSTTLKPQLAPSSSLNATGELERLLKCCNQTTPLAFEAFWNTFIKDQSVKKIGEATFSEVFMLSDNSTVLKIVPLAEIMPLAGPITFMRLSDAFKELKITKTLGSLPGFIQLGTVSVVQGFYPAPILQAWDAWRLKEESFNTRPDSNVLECDQLFIVLGLEYGGEDLEHFCKKEISNEQRLSVIRQIAGILGQAEEAFEFEHRDLHWGNVLVNPTLSPKVTFTLQGREIEVATEGIECVLIDFSYSRISIAPSNGQKAQVIYVDLNDDPELFAGDADCDSQFRVYRAMKCETKSDWQGFHPRTNILWLSQLLDKLTTPANRRSISTVRKQLASSDSAKSFLLNHFPANQ